MKIDLFRVLIASLITIGCGVAGWNVNISMKTQESLNTFMLKSSIDVEGHKNKIEEHEKRLNSHSQRISGIESVVGKPAKPGNGYF